MMLLVIGSIGKMPVKIVQSLDRKAIVLEKSVLEIP